MHINVSHSESKALLRSAQALSGNWWRQQWAIFPQRHIQYSHLPWSGSGTRGQPHSPDVSEYTQASGKAHSLQRQPWDQAPHPGAVPYAPSAEGGVYTTSASPTEGQCGKTAAQGL